MRRALFIVALFVFCLSCRRHTGDLRVRVVYSADNPALIKLRQAEREFSFTDARLHSGKPFAILATTSTNPGAALADKTRSVDIDLWVLKSTAEVPEIPDLRKEMGDSFSVCESVAYIPEWVNEERREGAARFLQYLATRCR